MNAHEGASLLAGGDAVYVWGAVAAAAALVALELALLAARRRDLAERSGRDDS